MTLHHAVLALSLLGLGGCGLGSLSAVVPDQEDQFDARLIGTWADSESNESAVITGDSSKGYTVVYTDDDAKVGTFEGHLGTLGNYRVLDLRPAELQLTASDVYKALLLRLHAAVFIDSIGSIVRVRMMEPDSLKSFLEREPDAVPHAVVDDEIVLTAATAELRSFLITYLRRPGVFGDSTTWVRRAP